MTKKEQKIGKIDANLFNTFLQHRLGASDSSVLVPPRTGIDAGVVSLGNGEVLIVAEDPIFAIPGQPLEMFGWYTVHIGASDVAVMGVTPRYMTYSLLLPPDTPDADIKTIVNSIHEAASELGIAIVGGHTGYYPGFAAPTIGGVTVFAIAKEGTYVTPAGARPGNLVLLTKGPAIETAGILSVLREKDLLTTYDPKLIHQAQALCKKMSVVQDALVAMKTGHVTAMHDATEGGVIGGLFEIAYASGVGMEIDETLFIYPPEVKMVCEYFAIDPIKSIAEGSLLITAEKEGKDEILASLGKCGIVASVIGHVTEDPDHRTITRINGTTIPLAVPDQDPFWPVFFESVS
jgi:hydrogenase expression/formation protein HypE